VDRFTSDMNWTPAKSIEVAVGPDPTPEVHEALRMSGKPFEQAVVSVRALAQHLQEKEHTDASSNVYHIADDLVVMQEALSSQIKLRDVALQKGEACIREFKLGGMTIMEKTFRTLLEDLSHKHISPEDIGVVASLISESSAKGKSEITDVLIHFREQLKLVADKCEENRAEEGKQKSLAASCEELALQLRGLKEVREELRLRDIGMKLSAHGIRGLDFAREAGRSLSTARHFITA
jgi:hypothetical protein